jgi:hypothetical protein
MHKAILQHRRLETGDKADWTDISLPWNQLMGIRRVGDF